ncbi:unnamed protein product [Darwinula stevensoni]|uniref:Uncharacterized protein n=1 Tax=Darwinula stevensoni TaxID=69355 RepID=A0A7R9AEP5_9CRUS|nr:unnamed protein product [Darwinula stevensoni]CAG0902239.1 unnamed protein product [Darwinula stevensoni]
MTSMEGVIWRYLSLVTICCLASGFHISRNSQEDSFLRAALPGYMEDYNLEDIPGDRKEVDDVSSIYHPESWREAEWMYLPKKKSLSTLLTLLHPLTFKRIMQRSESPRNTVHQPFRFGRRRR